MQFVNPPGTMAVTSPRRGSSAFVLNRQCPIRDLAWWIAVDRCLSEGIGIERLPGFPNRQATITREEMVGRTVRHFTYYELLG